AGVNPSKAERVEATVQAAAGDGCPTEVFGNDWYCFYQYKNFGGRRLQWNAYHQKKFYFSKYDFVNRTSSWSNKGALIIRVYGRTVSGSDASCNNVLWDMGQHSRNAALGSHLDNRADCFDTIGTPN
ncbi:MULTISPECIES: peptidase inhibitor family I36 protein, partial [Streptomyces]|uniref:peptidase inhibitor family I36 protein n=1 Tax=Streptomyces TaxID=1883 RepID=UPI002249169B